METKKINQPETSHNKGENNGKLRKTAAMGATAVAGVAAGAVGMDVMNGDGIEESVTVPETMTAQNMSVQPEHVASEPALAQEEPQPVTGEGTSGEIQEPVSPQEPSVDIEEPMLSSGELTEPNIVNNIIHGEEIDPADVDMADIINVDQIGTVYTVDGKSMLAAAIHDSDGNELMMVDVDGDGVFDVITSPEGEAIAEVGGDIDISDAEHMMTGEDGGWLAVNEFDNSMDVGSDILDDIIEA